MNIRQIVLLVSFICTLAPTKPAAAQALNFGAYSYISIGALLTDNHSYTKEAWVRVYATKAVHGRNFISSYDAPFWLENGVLSAANSYGAFPHKAILRDTQSFPLNVWVHIAVAYDAHCNVMTLYRNGNPVAIDSFAPGYSMGAIQLGATGSGDFLDGVDMDEVRIWGVALTRSQVQCRMDSDIVQQDGLLAYYKFNEGAAGKNNSGVLSATDYSGHHNNGQFFNFKMCGMACNFVKSRKGCSAGPVAGDTVVCAGASVAFSAIKPNGVWRSSNAPVGAVGATGSFTANTAGATVISYTLANGCSSVKTMHVYPVPVADATIVSENGDQGANGSIAATVLSGTPPYNYSWDNGATTPVVTGLKEGIYRLLVSDAHGCSAHAAYIVTRPAAQACSAETGKSGNGLAIARQP